MSKLNKKSINLSFKFLSILAFSVLLVPAVVSADYYGTNVKYGDLNSPVTEVPKDNTETINPKPSIYSISPKSADKNANGKTITINGRGFIPSSVARINGANRVTTFIDSSHLLVQANGADMYRTDGGFYVTVWNNAPGGGYSNSEFFTVKNIAVANTNQNSNNNSYQNTSDNNTNNAGYFNSDENFSDLTSNAIYGSNSFLPSGAVQWVLFAIIILLLVILARKFFGGEEHYLSTPLKHD